MPVASPRGYRNVTISFGALALPVKLVVTGEDNDVSLINVHRGCGARINKPNVCTAHLDDAGNKIMLKLGSQDIERMFEVAEGMRVPISDEDLESLPTAETKQVVELSDFVDAAAIPPILNSTTYYLYPQPAGLMQYELMSRVLADRQRVGVGRITLTTRESLCIIRPDNGSLSLQLLRWPENVRPQPEREVLPVSDEMFGVAGMLVDALTRPFDPTVHRDRYQDALRTMVQQKVAGTPALVAPVRAAPQSTDLMSALKDALHKAQAERAPEVPEVPAKAKRTRKADKAA